MHRITKLFTIFLLLVTLSSCSSLSWLKFWGDDEDEIELPAILDEITKKVIINSLWEVKVGKEKPVGRILPSISGDKVFLHKSRRRAICFREKYWKKAMGKGNK